MTPTWQIQFLFLIAVLMFRNNKLFVCVLCVQAEIQDTVLSFFASKNTQQKVGK